MRDISINHDRDSSRFNIVHRNGEIVATAATVEQARKIAVAAQHRIDVLDFLRRASGRSAQRRRTGAK
jgi:hypothetical protein